MKKSTEYPKWSDIKHKYYSPEELAIEDLYAKLLKEILEARKSKNISQKDLEKLSGVKQQVISRFETGESNPNIITVIKLMAALGKEITITNITTEASSGNQEKANYPLAAQG